MLEYEFLILGKYADNEMANDMKGLQKVVWNKEILGGKGSYRLF